MVTKSAFAADPTLSIYLKAIKAYPILSYDDEVRLVKAYKNGSMSSGQRVIESYLRLAAKNAMAYKSCGLPISDLISEGSVGLMQALNKYDVEKGFRFSTYAAWWVRAQIQTYLMTNWSQVKLGTNASEKRLFFNLRKLQGQLKAVDNGYLKADHVAIIAEKLGVKEEDVIMMDIRMTQPISLNTPVGDDEVGAEIGDTFADPAPSHLETLSEIDESAKRRALLGQAMDSLTERARDVFFNRRIAEPGMTLDALGIKYGVSRERVRQIEAKALQDVAIYMRRQTPADVGNVMSLESIKNPTFNEPNVRPARSQPGLSL